MNLITTHVSKLLAMVILSILCLVGTQLEAQVISDGDLPEALVVCGESQTIEVVVTGPYTGGLLTATMPTGYNYVGISTYDDGCAKNNDSDPDAPVFSFPMLTAAVVCTLSQEVVLDCDAFKAIDEDQGGDGDFLFIIENELDNGTSGSSAPTIMTKAPKLNVDIVTNGSPAYREYVFYN